MIAAWMLYASAVTAFILVGAVALERSLRLARRPARWIVAAAMMVSLILPFVAGSESAGAGAGAVANGLLSPTSSLAPLTAILPRSGTLAELDIPLIVFWIGLSALLLIVVTLTHVQVARKIRDYPKEKVDEATVLRSPVLGPAVVGLLKSSIVLPTWVDEVGRDWRGLMVLHEQEHLRGRDALLLSAAVLIVVVLPWNLPLWCLLLRLRRAIELDCDQRVLSSGVDVRLYGSLLLEVSRRRVRSPLPVIGLAFNRSFLAQRVDAMTQHMSRFRYPRALAAVVLGGAFVAIACELPAPVDPDLNTQTIPQEVAEASPMSNAVLAVSFQEDSGVTFAIRPQPGDLHRISRALDLYAVANESTLVRVPEELAERIRSGKLLLVATEQDGEPVVLLRKLREQGNRNLYPDGATEPAGTR
jgi:beta-lactamase regulating signal transducer with metallopeptidase domain